MFFKALGFPTIPGMHIFPLCATCPIHCTHFGFLKPIILCEDYQSRIFSLHSFVNLPFTSSTLEPHNFLSILFSNTLNTCSTLNIKCRVSHLYKKFIPSFPFKIQGTLKDYQIPQQIPKLHPRFFWWVQSQSNSNYETKRTSKLFPLLRKLKPPPPNLDIFALYR